MELIYEFSKIIKYKVNIHKSVINTKIHNAINKENTVYYSNRDTKYIGMNPTKSILNLCQ